MRRDSEGDERVVVVCWCVVNGTSRRLRSASAGTRWTNPAERSQNFTWAEKGNRETDQDSIGSSRHHHSAKPRYRSLALWPASRPLTFRIIPHHNTAYILATYVHLTSQLSQTPSIPSFLISARAGPPDLPGRSSSFTIGSASNACASSRTFRPKLPRIFKW